MDTQFWSVSKPGYLYVFSFGYMKSCWWLKNNKTNHKIRQTPRYSFLSICFIWQSSNSDSSHSIYSSSSSLLHFNLSLSPKFLLQNHCSTMEEFPFLTFKCYSWILLSVQVPWLSSTPWMKWVHHSHQPWSLKPYTSWSGSAPGSCHWVSALTPLPSQASLLQCPETGIWIQLSSYLSFNWLN